MKILLTGVTGFIGENVVKSLLDKKHSVVVLVRRNSDTSRIDKRATQFVYSHDINELMVLFQHENFDGVIHLASLFLVAHRSEEVPSLILSNIQFGTELLEACKQAKTKWFINTGTFWQHYQNETYNPVNLYAATKQAFEDIAKYYTETSDLIFTTLKLNDTFGPNDRRNKVLNFWHRISQTGEILEMSPGEQIIDTTYIEDVVSAYELLIDHLLNNSSLVKNKTFALYSNERISLKKLSQIFEVFSGKILNIHWGKKEYREREIMIPCENIAPLPNWKSKYTLNDAIKKTIS